MKPDVVPTPGEEAEIDIYASDDLFVKQMWLKKAGSGIAQHSHDYDHVTMLATGVVDVWIDDQPVGRHAAPKPFPIKAGTKHLFIAVVDNTILYCIHNLHGNGYPAIREIHEI